MLTRIIKIEDAASFELGIKEAAACLQEGRLVAIPTETVYGLAANAFESSAVEQIYQVKGRPSRNPLIVHVADSQMTRRCTTAWPTVAARLAEAFWPGPLTLVLPKSDSIPAVVTAGGSTVALRWPSHPVAQAVIARCGFPLAAPSANPSNQVSPTSAEHVFQGLDGRIPLILDAGPCAVGIESTVVDVTGPVCRVLRPGIISSAQIAQVLGGTAFLDETGAPADGPLPSPGMLTRHYSPKARLVLAKWKSTEELQSISKKFSTSPARVHVIAYHEVPTEGDWGRVVVIPEDAEAYARALYAEIRLCDTFAPDCILVEHPPQGPEWEGILDRLGRASSLDE